MKKIFITLFLSIITLTVSAEVIYLTGYNYYQKTEYQSSYTNYGKCNVSIVVNTDRSTIRINNGWDDIFYIYDSEIFYNEGQKCYRWRAVDGDDVYCTIRWQKRRDGRSQIYLDYVDISYVYDVR